MMRNAPKVDDISEDEEDRKPIRDRGVSFSLPVGDAGIPTACAPYARRKLRAGIVRGADYPARRTMRVISEGTPTRQEKPFHSPVPGLTYRLMPSTG